MVQADDHFGFFFVTDGVKPRGFAWAWRERVHPNKPKVENPGVLAVRVADKHEAWRWMAPRRLKAP